VPDGYPLSFFNFENLWKFGIFGGILKILKNVWKIGKFYEIFGKKKENFDPVTIYNLLTQSKYVKKYNVKYQHYNIYKQSESTTVILW
jgi:hypothetical protein